MSNFLTNFLTLAALSGLLILITVNHDAAAEAGFAEPRDASVQVEERGRKRPQSNEPKTDPGQILRGRPSVHCMAIAKIIRRATTSTGSRRLASAIIGG